MIPRKHAATTEHAAWVLGMSRPLVVKLLQAGVLPYHRVGNRRLIYLDDILEYRRREISIRKSEFAERDKQN